VLAREKKMVNVSLLLKVGAVFYAYILKENCSE
jgi:hypothetical protein